MTFFKGACAECRAYLLKVVKSMNSPGALSTFHSLCKRKLILLTGPHVCNCKGGWCMDPYIGFLKRNSLFLPSPPRLCSLCDAMCPGWGALGTREPSEWRGCEPPVTAAWAGDVDPQRTVERTERRRPRRTPKKLTGAIRSLGASIRAHPWPGCWLLFVG